MKRSFLFGLVSLLCFGVQNAAFSQLTVVPNHTAAVLASKLAGPGISISSPTLTCAGAANGTFISVTTPIIIDSGIVLTTGNAANTAGLETFLASTNNGGAGDPALAALAGATTFNACVLEFDFIPKGDTVSFNYQFGSEEYINSTCGQYNDAFAFFISGPGIVGTQNMALVPGTNIPVTVNSINSGVPGPPGFPGFCNIANCTAMGPGSPFTTFFVNNLGGTQVTYRGYTTKLLAQHRVTPCSTYHLKLTVADASNSLYDSGVFIEAGSLKTNSYFFKKNDSIGHTIAGIPNAFVKGCAPAPITVLNSRTTGTPQRVYFTYGGTAIRGIDFSAPDSATIAPGDTSVIINLSGITTTPGGVKTVFVYLSSPFSCGVVDTVQLNILDRPTAIITTPDTAICLGASLQILVSGTPGLVYNWSPAATLSSAVAMQPIATPTALTTYTMSATLPLSGCAAITDAVSIGVNVAAINVVTPDTSICKGGSIEIDVAGTPGLVYSWAPGASLDDPNLKNPTASPLTTTTYSLSATSTIGGCPAFATITITVIDPVVQVLTRDTAICPGKFAAIRVSGNPSYLYDWAPATYLDDATLMEPISTPLGPITYTVTVTVPGFLCQSKDVFQISILPDVVATASGGRTVCVKEPINLEANPIGDDYIYQWSGPNSFSSIQKDPFIRSALAVHEGIYSVTVTNTVTGCSGVDTTYIKVGDASLTLLDITKKQTISLGSSIQLDAGNGSLYTWMPNDGSLNNPNINNPIATPLVTTVYTVMAVDSNGCIDTASVLIEVASDDDVFVPSGFTPNADGTNDIFRVVNLGKHKMVMMSVFNRWGEQIFRADDGSNLGWDGTQNGKPADMGTFNYIIILGKPDGTNKTITGTVTLIR